MDSQQKRAVNYIKNTGGNPSIDWFDDDHEPIGKAIRHDLKKNKLIVEHDGRILLTDKGEGI